MSFLEPDDPIEPACSECGEEEAVQHDQDAMWICFACGANFSDGTDNDDSQFHNE